MRKRKALLLQQTRMKKIAGNPLATKPNTDIDGYRVRDGVKKPPKPEAYRTEHYTADSVMPADVNACESSKSMIEAALKIARHRRETLDKIRDAFARNDEAEVLRLAKQLCGIKDDKEVHRTDSRIH